MSRFACRLEAVPVSEGRAPGVTLADGLPGYGRPEGGVTGADGVINLASGRTEVTVNRNTGLIDSFRRDGKEYLLPGAFRPLVMRDNADSWGITVNAFRDVEGEFTLLSPEESARFAGVPPDRLDPVRVIEEGPIRTTVEALLGYRESRMAIRYTLSKEGDDLQVSIRVSWLEGERMLKLSVPTPLAGGGCRGEVVYGVEEFDRPAEELVAQKWVGLVSADGGEAVTIINDGTYGFDFEEGELRLSLLRSPAFAGHPVDGDVTIIRSDRFEPRIDRGERSFTFWFEGGPAAERFSRVGREALARNETPAVLCCHPSGTGKKPAAGVILSDDTVLMTAMKLAEGCERLILRLFNPTGTDRTTTIRMPSLGFELEVALRGFEIRTLALDAATGETFETDLLERRLT